MPDQDVPELGQFVEFGIAQVFAEGGDALIAGGGDSGAIVAVLVLVHGAEFEDAEGFAVAAGAETAVEDRAGRIIFKL